MWRRHPGCRNLRLLGILPIIIGSDDATGAVVDFEGGISQCARHAELGQRRAKGANKDVGRACPRRSHDKSANHNVTARLDLTTGADIDYR